jgi:hypothetical protein
MLSLRRAAAIVAMLLAGTACSSDDPSDLFEGQDTPTPNVLKGVYKLNIDEPGATIEIRLRFKSDEIVGAVRCTSKAEGGGTLEAGGTVPFDGDADAAAGSFTIDALVLEKNAPPFYCQAGLRAGTYDFKVEEFKLTLTTQEVVEPIIYAKVGD